MLLFSELAIVTSETVDFKLERRFLLIEQHTIEFRLSSIRKVVPQRRLLSDQRVDGDVATFIWQQKSAVR